MDLTFTIRTAGRYQVIGVGGEIDAYTAPHLREYVVNVIDGGHRHVVVDLEQVGFLDSSGLAVLLLMLERVRRAEGSLSLVCARENILKLFRITGLTNVFSIHHDLAFAITGSPASVIPEAVMGASTGVLVASVPRAR